jgi:hypothetical protein
MSGSDRAHILGYVTYWSQQLTKTRDSYEKFKISEPTQRIRFEVQPDSGDPPATVIMNAHVSVLENAYAC